MEYLYRKRTNIENIGYISFRFIVFLFRLIPFNVLYSLSNFIGWFLHKVIKYRLKVIEANLDYTLSHLSPADRADLIRKYYLTLADLLLESFKACSMPKKELEERFKCVNPEFFDSIFEDSNGLIIATSHLGNWEWAAIMWGEYIPNDTFVIFKPLSNKLINGYLYKVRSKYKTMMVEMKNTARIIYRQEALNPYSITLVSDQSPVHMSKAIWTSFLDVETPFLNGLDDLSRRYKMPVVYADIKKVRRGYYELEFSLLESQPQTLNRGEVTAKYALKVSALIKERPSEWLWSHKRWKRVTPPIYD